MKNEQEIKIGADWWANTEERRGNGYYPNLYDDIVWQIRYPVLDIGGGDGSFLKYLNIENATIMDLAGNNVLKNKNYKFIKVDISKKIPKNKRYRTIFIMETLEHLSNPLYLMAQVHDLLEDDGHCYVMIPYTQLDLNRSEGLNSHVSRWTDYQFQDQMEKLGFEIEFIQKRRRFKNLGFWLPHCNLVARLWKRREQ